MSRDWVRLVRSVVAVVLFAAATIPAGLVVVWLLAWGGIAPAAAGELGMWSLASGVLGWVILPRRRRPVLAGHLTGPGGPLPHRDDPLEQLWRMPARTPSHERGIRIVLPESELGGDLDVGDRDW